MIQIVERIPEEKRSAGLTQILEKARAKADEISFLIVEIDEAVRFNDRATALRKADDLLKVKPGHHRALKVQQEFAGYGAGGAARIGLARQFTQPWNEGGWIPWSVLAFGLGVFGVVAAVIVIWLGGTLLVIDSDDPGIKIEIPGRDSAMITLKGEQSVKVTPGDHTLTISYAGLETQTKSFSIKSGGTVKLRVWIADSSLHALFKDEKFEAPPGGEKAQLAGKGPGGMTEKEPKDSKANQPLALVLPGKEGIKRKTRPASQGPPSARPPAPVENPAPSVTKNLTGKEDGSLVAPFDEARAKTAQEQWSERLKTPVQLANSIKMRLQLIPPGRFQMGSSGKGAPSLCDPCTAYRLRVRFTSGRTK